MRRRSLLKQTLLAGLFLVFCLQFATVAQTAALDEPAVTATPKPGQKTYFLPYVGNSVSAPTLPPPGTSPSQSSSVYMLSIDSTKNYNLGCQYGDFDRRLSGTRDTVVILDFGSPKRINGELGTDLILGYLATITQIKAAVENFGRGYYVCANTDRTSQIFIGIGTTNYYKTLSSVTTDWYAHGTAWAQMVNEVNSWFKINGYASQVHAAGAIDIELSWSSPAIARAWISGYDSANLYDYYDFGTLDGCPYSTNPYSINCGNGWTREDAWFKAYGTRPAFPIPEIYARNGVNAKQWALLSLYSVNTKGYPIEFPGVMTQYQACVQDSSGWCVNNGLDNTPELGWTQLYNELKKDSRTAYIPRWATDIRWGFELTAADPGLLATQADSLAIPQADVSDPISRYDQALALPNLDSQMRDSLLEKQAIARQFEDDRSYALAHPASKDATLAPAAPVAVDAEVPTGIFEGAGGAAHAWEGDFANYWQGIQNGEYVLVSAGSAAEDAATGLVMVMRVSMDRSQLSREFYATPLPAGPVRVSTVTGSQVLLSAEDGISFTFDLDTGQFQ